MPAATHSTTLFIPEDLIFTLLSTRNEALDIFNLRCYQTVLEHQVMFKNNNTMNRSIILDVKKYVIAAPGYFTIRHHS
jgi:hypothetical protein